jgi:hypothetical protein
VVRRLVEEEQVGLADERARERGLRHLAAGERVQLAPEVCVDKAETAGDRRRPLAPRVAAGMLEPLLCPGVGGKRHRVVSTGRHRLLEAAEVGFHRQRLPRAADHVGLQAEIPVERGSLVVESHTRALGERELTPVPGCLAGQHPQERRLAGAVRAEQGETVTTGDRERDVAEQSVAGELLAQVRCDHDRHVPIVAEKQWG